MITASRLEAKSVPKLLRFKEEACNSSATIPPLVNGIAQYRDEEYFEAFSDQEFEGEESPNLLGIEDDVEDDVEEDVQEDVQDSYYTALEDRFFEFSDLIRSILASEGVQSQVTLPKALQEYSKAAEWTYELKHTTPTLSSLLSVTQSDVFRGLARVGYLLTRAAMMADDERTNLGCWSWALLGCCRDIGTLDNEGISNLRQLGKTSLALAATLQRSRGHYPVYLDETSASVDMSDASEPEETSVMKATNEVENGTNGAHDEAASENSPANLPAAENLEETRRAMLERLEGTATDDEPLAGEATSGEKASEERIEERIEDALATLDIIVTVVGSFFGQSDLLDMRMAWQ
jgi:Survival motor neuron (SMN) interacting protein 1 (SIP1)